MNCSLLRLVCSHTATRDMHASGCAHARGSPCANQNGVQIGLEATVCYGAGIKTYAETETHRESDRVTLRLHS